MKKIFRGLKLVTSMLTIGCILLSYGSYDAVVWIGALSMAVASGMLTLLPEELF